MASSDQIRKLVHLKFRLASDAVVSGRRQDVAAIDAEYTRLGTAGSGMHLSASIQHGERTLSKTIDEFVLALKNELTQLAGDEPDVFYGIVREEASNSLKEQVGRVSGSIITSFKQKWRSQAELAVRLSFASYSANLLNRLGNEIEALRLSAKMASSSRLGANSKVFDNMSEKSKKVFVIHGRNMDAVKQMGYFLRTLGLEPINFSELRSQMGGTPTIADIIARGMDEAQGVIALFTADEHAWLRPVLRSRGDEGEMVERWQARPNVIFESGMAFGRARDRVVFVLLGDVKLFSDVAGVHLLRPNNDPKGDRDVLRRTLGSMGCSVNNSSDWMSAGDFESCVRHQELSLRDPFAVDVAPPEVSAKSTGGPEKFDWSIAGQSIVTEFSFPRVYERRNLLVTNVELLAVGRLPPGVRVYSWKLFKIYVNGHDWSESRRFDTTTTDLHQVGRTRLDGEVRLDLDSRNSAARSISISAQLLLELSVPELIKVQLSVPERYCGVFEYGA